jgi:hypothetical protein
MLIVWAYASETALMEIIVAIEDILQKGMGVGHTQGCPYWLIQSTTVG